MTKSSSTGLERMAAALLLGFALLAASCSSTVELQSAEDEPVAIDPTEADDLDGATTAPGPTSTPTRQDEPTETSDPEAEPTVIPAIEAGPTFFSADLESGDCILRVSDAAFQPPDVVSCDEPHLEEIYAIGSFDDGPDAPFPGEDELIDRAAAELCDQATLDFFGGTWDQIPVSTYVLYPLLEEWEAGDRFLGCSAAGNGDVLKIGTAAGGTLVSDDVLLTRASLAIDGVDFVDWSLMRQYGTFQQIRSVTNGEFELPLHRALMLRTGFVFAGDNADLDGGDSIFGLEWEDARAFEVASPLPTHDLGGVVTTDDLLMFAARQDQDSDWDLWTVVDDEARVFVGGDGDQRFPTPTPDGTQIVYHDRGNLWIVDIDGSNARQLTDDAASDWESIVSPDGQTVVFASNRSGNDDIWSMPITGGEPVNLTDHPADESWPVFSQDGALIYFGTDRLDPDQDRQRMMMMRADGSEPSWFSGPVPGGQANVVPQSVADRLYADTPTISERYEYERLDGDPGTSVSWEHSTERIQVDLPAGWLVTETTGGTGFVAGPGPDRYFETWDIDGVQATIVDGESADDFFARYSDTAAANQCDRFDGSGEIFEAAPNRLALTGNFGCSTSGAVGGVIAFYNTESGVGLLLEGQSDGLPDGDTDAQTLLDIATSIQWR